MSYQYAAFPELVLALAPHTVAQVACGDEHSAAVTSKQPPAAFLSPLSNAVAHIVSVLGTGARYCWGCGRGGRLGTGSEDDEFLPRQIESLSTMRIVEVTCGKSQTVTDLLPGTLGPHTHRS